MVCDTIVLIYKLFTISKTLTPKKMLTLEERYLMVKAEEEKKKKNVCC
jgi:hypothetical protein